MHTCTKCGETKDASKFYTRENGRLRNQCRSCFNRKSGGSDEASAEHLAILKQARTAGTLERMLMARYFGADVT